ncbi:MAG: hypothetical protein D6802_10570, partial [Ardenticatenia bacterium]
MNSKFLRSGLFWLLIIVIGIAVFMNFGTARSTQSPDSIQQLALEIKAGRIRDITVRGDTITAERYDGTRLITRKGSNVTAVEALKNLGVTEEELQSLEAFIVQDDSQLRGLGFLLSSALPLLLFGGLLIFMLRQAQGSN